MVCVSQLEVKSTRSKIGGEEDPLSLPGSFSVQLLLKWGRLVREGNCRVEASCCRCLTMAALLRKTVWCLNSTAGMYECTQRWVFQAAISMREDILPSCHSLIVNILLLYCHYALAQGRPSTNVFGFFSVRVVLSYLGWRWLHRIIQGQGHSEG